MNDKTMPSLTPKQIEAGWHATFSTNNPCCPCDLKTFTKAVRWTERQADAQTPPRSEFKNGKQRMFAVDIFGNPMREREPGKWETALWPSNGPPRSEGVAMGKMVEAGLAAFKRTVICTNRGILNPVPAVKAALTAALAARGGENGNG